MIEMRGSMALSLACLASLRTCRYRLIASDGSGIASIWNVDQSFTSSLDGDWRFKLLQLETIAVLAVHLLSSLPRGEPMTNAYDLVIIGNAIVDVLARCDEDFIVRHKLPKGSMRLVDADAATALYAAMGPGREVSGGSGANAAVGAAALGRKVRFIGRVSDDQLGEVFAHDIRASGVIYETPFAKGNVPTARCLILVTPDAQRTMNTFLGSSQHLSNLDVDYDAVAASPITYLEGYLWDAPVPRAAMEKAIDAAHGAGQKVAFTLSDVFCIESHRQDFQRLAGGRADILFANENELKALYQTDDFDAAVAQQRGKCEIAVITRSEKGALVLTADEVVSVPAEPAAAVIDTTGAGDLFAAGFLTGLSEGRSLERAAIMGAVAAAEIISHIGARPEADLRALVDKRFA
jgi:sugar/nucleoside kinase (ribokinase family)